MDENKNNENSDLVGNKGDVLLADQTPVITEQIQRVNYEAMKAQQDEDEQKRRDMAPDTQNTDLCVTCCCDFCEVLCDIFSDIFTCMCLTICCTSNGCDDCCACGDSGCCGDCCDCGDCVS